MLRERVSQGRAIIEKFEENARDVAFAVVILTADDFASSVGSEEGRVRQNVLFELGYFSGKLGRSKALLLKKGEIEIPSDLLSEQPSDLTLDRPIVFQPAST